jgi:hypothetical protein
MNVVKEMLHDGVSEIKEMLNEQKLTYSTTISVSDPQEQTSEGMGKFTL